MKQTASFGKIPRIKNSLSDDSFEWNVYALEIAAQCPNAEDVIWINTQILYRVYHTSYIQCVSRNESDAFVYHKIVISQRLDLFRISAEVVLLGGKNVSWFEDLLKYPCQPIELTNSVQICNIGWDRQHASKCERTSLMLVKNSLSLHLFQQNTIRSTQVIHFINLCLLLFFMAVQDHFYWRLKLVTLLVHSKRSDSKHRSTQILLHIYMYM